MITSSANERVKLTRALLSEGKTRRKAGAVALEGARLVSDALLAGASPQFVLFNPEQFDPASLPRPVDSAALLPALPEVFAGISATEHPQGVIGVFPTPVLPLPEKPTRVLILDALRDPGNAGTVLRTAAAAAAEVVIFAPGSVDATNDKVLRAAMGAHFRIAWREWRWPQIAGFCEGLPVYLADMVGEATYDQVNWAAPWALIVGGEAQGASAEAETLAVQRVTIPMGGGVESLNAAVAAGILLFEAYKAAR